MTCFQLCFYVGKVILLSVRAFASYLQVAASASCVILFGRYCREDGLVGVYVRTSAKPLLVRAG